MKMAVSEHATTQIGFGGAALARTPGTAGDAEAVDAIRTAVDAGITHFDTAPFYGHGLSEQRLGRGLSHVNRDNVTISTKVGFRLDPGQPNPEETGKAWLATLPNAARLDFSYEGAQRSLAQSIERLNLGSIDIAFVHGLGLNPDQIDAAVRGAFPALEEAKKRDQISRIGIAVNDPQTASHLLARIKPDIIMLAGGLSLADASAIETLLPHCDQSGIEIWPAAPFSGGILARDNQAIRITNLHKICVKHGIEPIAAALQFPICFGSSKRVFAGLRTVSQIADATRAMTQKIPAEFWDEAIPIIQINTNSLASRSQLERTNP